uniref:Uncharacterized protein n=1 Tax=Picea sitchensis TaxID=3332 RepID=A0A6B9XPZ1_PICSI|nr:hypothetical protein Q903MT_gene4103 [Picea sitchensis]
MVLLGKMMAFELIKEMLVLALTHHWFRVNGYWVINFNCFNHMAGRPLHPRDHFLLA